MPPAKLKSGIFSIGWMQWTRRKIGSYHWYCACAWGWNWWLLHGMVCVYETWCVLAGWFEVKGTNLEVKGIVSRYKRWLPANWSCTRPGNKWTLGVTDKFACSYIQICPLRLSLPGGQLSKHRVGCRSYTYQYSYSLAVPNRRLQTSEIDRRECLRAACVRYPHTSMDYTVILGVPIPPVPSLIEFLN